MELINVIVFTFLCIEMNIILAEVEKSWIEVNSLKGIEELVTADGKRMEFEIKSKTVKQEIIHTVHVEIENYQNKTMEDIEGDDTLVAGAKPQLNWSANDGSPLNRMSINYNLLSISAKINDKNLFHYKNGGFGGVILATLNVLTSKETYHQFFPTNQFGVYRKLNWVLESISSGSLVMLIAMDDGSTLFHNTTRENLSKMGTSWSKYYLYRDSWIVAFIKGGRTLVDVLIPNLGSEETLASGLNIDIHFPDVLEKDYDEDYCKLWPDEGRWKARKIFCASHDGLKALCDCSHPFDFQEKNNKMQGHCSDASIPVSILSGNRVHLLFRLLEDLGDQPGMTQDLIVIVMDGFQQDVAELGFILGIQVLLHRPEGIGGTRISRALRFALFHMLKLFPEAKYFINLEDDLIVANDFYSFMCQAAPVFELDKSVWCVTAFNLFSYPHTSTDPSQLYRGHFNPSLGWMMPRDVIEEILPKWPPSILYHNWDFFLALPSMNKGRVCIMPDVLRVNQPFGGGTHFKVSWFAETHFGNRLLNQEINTQMQPLERLILQNYDDELMNLTKEAFPLEIYDAHNFSLPHSKNGVVTIYLNKTDPSFANTSRVVHWMFGVWDAPQISIMDAERFYYKNAKILIISVPSRYSAHVPKNYHYFSATNEDMERILKREDKAFDALLVQTHFNKTQL